MAIFGRAGRSGKRLLILFIFPIALIAGGIGGMCSSYIGGMRGTPAVVFALVATVSPILAIFLFVTSLASSEISARGKLVFLILYLVLILLLVIELNEYVTRVCFTSSG